MVYSSKKKPSKADKDEAAKDALIAKWRARKSDYEREATTYLSEGKSAWAEFLGSSPEEIENEVKRGDKAYSHVSKYVQASFYSRKPLVVGTGDFDGADSVGVTAAYLAERLGKRFTNSSWFDESIEGSRDDYVHTSRGLTRVYVDTDWVSVPVRTAVAPLKQLVLNQETQQPEEIILYFKADKTQVDESEVKVDEKGPYVEETKQEIKAACPYLSHVSYKDYFHTPKARIKKMLTWEMYRLQMSLDEIKERWGDEYEDLIETKDTDKAERNKGFIDIYECWCKAKETVVYLYLGGSGCVLGKELDDPYDLDGFFPSVGPIVSSKLTDKLWGVSDFTCYKDKLDYLKSLDKRRKYLSTLLRRNGIGDGKHKDNLILLNENQRDGDIIFVDNYVDLVSDSQKSEGLVKFFPTAEYTAAFNECTEAYFGAKQEYYEYFGLERLLAAQDTGDTSADEAQLTASLGLLYTSRHRKFQTFILDNIKKLIDLAVRTLPMEVFKQLVGYDFLPENHKMNFEKAYEVLQSDFDRAVRVEIDLDSTIASSRESQVQANMTLFNTVTQSLGPLTDIAQTKPEFMAPLASIVMSAVSKMQGSSAVNDDLKQGFQQLIQVASTPPATEEEPVDPMIAIKEQEVAIKGMLAEHKVNIESQEQAFKQYIESEKQALAEQKAAIDGQEKMMQEQRLAQEQQTAMTQKLMEIQQSMQEMKNDTMLEILKLQSANQQAANQPVQSQPVERPDNTAAIVTALAGVVQNMPQPVINVAAPQPTRRVGTIEKNGNSARIVVDEEGIE